MEFREEIKNLKGLRPIPIEMNGKTFDWNMFTRPEKQQLKKNLKKNAPKIWKKIELSKKIKIHEEPIAENVYICEKCNKAHVAHELDKGASPLFIECHNCKWPQAQSLGYDIPDSYKGATPNIILRLSTEAEYHATTPELREYLEKGGLWMEIIK